MQYLLWTTIEDGGVEEDLPWGSEETFDTEEEATKMLDDFTDHLPVDDQDGEGKYDVFLSIERRNDKGTRYEIIDKRLIGTFRRHRQANRLANRIHDKYQEFTEKRAQEAT